MNLFYTPDVSGTDYQLNEEESKHCIKVLRLKPGDTIYLIDGRGGLYTAKITEAHPKHTFLKIISIQKQYNKRNHYLHIAVAPTKNIERLEWFLEKAAEIGIDEVTPVICDRSERKEVKTERLNRIIISAIKQSLKAYVPKLNEPQKLKDFLSNSFNGQKFIAHCMEGEKSAVKDKIDLGGRYLVLIGPEGDFTRSEVNEAIRLGFIPVSLGDSRLRTETAALESCFEINFLNRET